MLDLLTAVLAFAAIMIMLATLVTVLVEAVQKVFRKRRAVNIDAVHLFKALVVNPTIAEKVSHSIEVLKRREAKSDAANTTAAPPPGDATPEADATITTKATITPDELYDAFMRARSERR